MNDFFNYVLKGLIKLEEPLSSKSYVNECSILKIDCAIYKFNPLQGGNYKELPEQIKNSKGCIKMFFMVYISTYSSSKSPC